MTARRDLRAVSVALTTLLVTATALLSKSHSESSQERLLADPPNLGWVRLVDQAFDQVVDRLAEQADEQPDEDGWPVSDDFSAAVLDEEVWTVTDPVDDGEISFHSAGTDDVQLQLTVPAGTSHDVWHENNALRITQDVADQDFEVETLFLSVPDEQFQSQGILVQQDHDNWLRFDVYSTETELSVFAGATLDGNTSKLIRRPIPAGSRIGLRVTRIDNRWIVDYSHDGLLWRFAGVFTLELSVTEVGLFAGNGEPNPEFTAEVARFTSTADTPRGEPPDAAYQLTTEVVGDGHVDQVPYSPDGFPEGAEVVLIADPMPGWDFTGWDGDASGASSATVVPIDGDRTVTAVFAQQPVTDPTIDVWYGAEQTFGSTGRSQRWVNILGSVTDGNGIESVTYEINDDGRNYLATGPDERRLFGVGDFNIQIPYTDLDTGPNAVSITAVDVLGNSTTTTVTVRKDVQPTSLPYAVAWDAAYGLNDVAQVVDGHWSMGADGLTIDELGYDRTIAIGDAGWSDYEVSVPVTVRALGPDADTPHSGAPAVGLGIHWTGHTTRAGEQPALDWYPTGAFAWYRWQSDGRFELMGNDDEPLDRESTSWDFDTTYVMKVRAERVDDGIEYSYKWWPQHTYEPDTWNLTILSDDGPTEGAVLLVAHHVDATFGDVVITPL